MSEGERRSKREGGKEGRGEKEGRRGKRKNAKI